MIREGVKAEEILKLIEEDEDIAHARAGRRRQQGGARARWSRTLAGKAAGSFPIPIAIVPGHLRTRKSTPGVKEPGGIGSSCATSSEPFRRSRTGTLFARMH